MCTSEPMFIIIQSRVYREEIIQTRNGFAHSTNCKQTQSTCSCWHFQFSHDTTSTIEIHHRRRYENVTDYCPHSYSYRMILIRISFVLELTIEVVRIFDTIKRASKWLSSLLFARRKNLISLSSFACLLELSVASNLLGVCIHTLSTCFHWYDM